VSLSNASQSSIRVAEPVQMYAIPVAIALTMLRRNGPDNGKGHRGKYDCHIMPIWKCHILTFPAAKFDRSDCQEALVGQVLADV
jgi:hypothetical protein